MNKKLLALLLALCLCLGCMPALADDVPVVTYLSDAGGTTADKDNMVLKAIEEAIGVKMDITQIPNADFAAKLNTMIASGTLPDVIQIPLTDAVQFQDADMLLPLNDLLAQHGSHIMAEVGDSLTAAPLNADGEIYGIISGKTGFLNNFMIRKDWLANVGMEVPTDLDSLYDVLYAFTYNDPDQNGENDTYGFMFSMANLRQLSHIFGAYHIAVDKYYELEDGTVTTYMKAPDYLNVIKYLRKLYQDGIISPDFVTYTNMNVLELLWSGRLGVLDFYGTGTVQNWYPGRYTFEVPKNPADLFTHTLIEGPTGLKGAYKEYPNLLNYMVITSTCENPEAAMKFIDFTYSEEGDELLNFGVEGVMWDWVDEEAGLYTRLGEYTDDTIHRVNGGYVYWDEGRIANNIELKVMRDYTREAQAHAWEHAFDYPVILSTLESEVEYGATLSEITKEALVQLITTEGDVEAEYAAFVERWNNEGGLALEAEATAAYQAQK